MDEGLTALTARLSKLRVRKTRTVNEFQSIAREEELVRSLIQESLKPTGTNSKGDSIRIGDKVVTLTRGRYYEKNARVTSIGCDNTITIESLRSKKTTWRKGHNLLKTLK